MLSIEQVGKSRRLHQKRVGQQKRGRHRDVRWVFQSAAKTMCGVRRAHDQDFVLAEDAGGIFAVADGVGGNVGGAEASEFVCAVFAQELLEVDTEGRFGLSAAKTALGQARDIAIEGMTKLAFACPDLDRMGTTLALGWAIRGRLFYAHAGDSRIYLIRGGKLTRLTSDHSFAQLMQVTKGISKDALKTHPYRNAITRSLGPASYDTRIDVASLWLRPGDKLIFLTDGVTNFIDDEAIEGLAALLPRREQLCETLIQSARALGSPDDVSCVVVDCDALKCSADRGDQASKKRLVDLESAATSRLNTFAGDHRRTNALMVKLESTMMKTT